MWNATTQYSPGDVVTWGGNSFMCLNTNIGQTPTDPISFYWAKLPPMGKETVYNVKDYGAEGDGVTDDTAAIQAAIDAAGISGGVVFLPPGVFLVKPATSIGIWLTALTIANPEIVFTGPGIIKHIPINATDASDVCLLLLSNTTDVHVSSIFDVNRDNLGPQAFNVSGGTGYQPTAVIVDTCTRCHVDVQVQNSPNFGVYLNECEGCVTSVNGENNVASLAVAGGSTNTVPHVVSVNVDAALVVTTTSSTAIPGGANATVTPASMANIAVGDALMVGLGTETFEYVLVSAVTSSTFTAYFAGVHSGTYAINDARFPTDSVCSVSNADNTVIESVNVNAESTLVPRGAALEIFACRGFSVQSVISVGTWRGVWIHNWTYSGTVVACSNGQVEGLVATNCVTSDSGLPPIGIDLDDNGTASPNFLEGVEVQGTVIYGEGGAAIPSGSVGVQDSPTSKRCRIRAYVFGVTSVSESGYGNNWQLLSDSSNSNGLEVTSASFSNHTLTIFSAASEGLLCADLNSCEFTVFIQEGPSGVDAIKFTSASNYNTIKGIVAGAPITYPPGGVGNTFILDSPAGAQSAPAVPASGTALTNPFSFDCTVAVTDTSTGTSVAVGGITVATVAAGSTVPVFVGAGQTITLTYTTAPTWAWTGH